MSKLFSLPPELLIHILLYLPASSILTCQRVSKHLNAVIRDSVELQYTLALDAAKVEDNGFSTLSTASKLEALKSSEDMWASVQASFIKSVPVEHRQLGAYTLSSGLFFLSNVDDTLVHSLKLPARKEDEIRWKDIRTTKPILYFGLCVFEHDLIVLVTSSPSTAVPGTQISFDIEVELRELSTDAPHPLAGKTTFYLMNSDWEKPCVNIEIVGKHLVIIVYVPYRNTTDRTPDRVFIFEWQKHILISSFEADRGSYSTILFLTEDLILLPNTMTGALDVFRISAVSTLGSPVPVVRLALPILSRNCTYDRISCRGDPNPIGRASIAEIERRAATGSSCGSNDAEPQRAWLVKAEDALCRFHLEIHGRGRNSFSLQRVNFVVHRRALVAVVEDFERANRNQKGRDRTTMDIASEGILTSNAISTSSTSDSASTIHADPLKAADIMSWKFWGSGITNWASSDITAPWIPKSSGQRFVRMRGWDWGWYDVPDAEPVQTFIVLDFNQSRVARTRKWLQAQPGCMEVLPGTSKHFVGIGLASAGGCIDGVGGLKGDVRGGAQTDSQGGADRVFTALYADEESGSDSGRCSICMNCNSDNESEFESEGVEVDSSDEDGSCRRYNLQFANTEALPSASASTSGLHALNGPAESVDNSDPSLTTKAGVEYAKVADTALGVSGRPTADWRWPPVGAVYWAPAGDVFALAGKIFAEPIVNGLPYVARVASGNYEYEEVILDEERVIGTCVRFDDISRRIERIAIQYFG